jgi:hypothetical protein
VVTAENLCGIAQPQLSLVPEFPVLHKGLPLVLCLCHSTIVEHQVLDVVFILDRTRKEQELAESVDRMTRKDDGTVPAVLIDLPDRVNKAPEYLLIYTLQHIEHFERPSVSGVSFLAEVLDYLAVNVGSPEGF